jgi:hypothetical protein
MPGTGHLPPRRDLCDFPEWQRQRPCLVRRVEYRRADNGMPVCVLVPTLRGRLAMLVRAWRQAG